MSKVKSDLEKFVGLYKSFGIDLKPSKHTTTIYGGNYDVFLGENISDKFGGYSGFESNVVFDKDGKFIRQAFYES